MSDLRAGVIVLALLLAPGCLGTAEDGLHEAAATARRDLVVIAVIDSGTTPYYPVFQTQDVDSATGAVPVPFEVLELSLPDGTDPIERDDAVWDTAEPGVLYHFAGTRLFGISFDSDREFHYVRDDSFHGVATTYLAARDAPDAVIVSVQIALGLCLQPNCVLSPTIPDAMEWVSEQDWIDIVSVSLALPANAPDHVLVDAEMARYMRASEAAARSGKIIVNGAANDVAPPITDYFNGPPWVIAVGGFEPGANGENVLSGKLVDVVANWTEYAPMFGEGEMAWRSGTSFATPVTAATMARALHGVRGVQPERTVTPKEIRDVLNASATYVAPFDWDPTPPGREPLPDDIVNHLTLPIVVQPQMGWGYVSSDLAEEMARRIVEDDFSIPASKDQAALFQPEWQRSRERFWATYAS